MFTSLGNPCMDGMIACCGSACYYCGASFCDRLRITSALSSLDQPFSDHDKLVFRSFTSANMAVSVDFAIGFDGGADSVFRPTRWKDVGAVFQS